MIAKCGAGGNYNDAHRSATLTINLFGTSGPFLPQPALDESQSLARRADNNDLCPGFQFTGISRWDCPKTPCAESIEMLNGDNGCVKYCEFRRTGFLGPQTMAPGKYGLAYPPGLGIQLAEGVKTSISQSSGVGLSGGWKDAIAPRINYGGELDCHSCSGSKLG